MKRSQCCLFLFLSVANVANITSAAETNEPSARDYNLSMAGALISGWCENNWQSSVYLTVYACNYQMAQRYNFEISSEHFGGCTVQAGGDIVQIANCMVARFDAWLVEEQLEESAGDSH